MRRKKTFDRAAAKEELAKLRAPEEEKNSSGEQDQPSLEDIRKERRNKGLNKAKETHRPIGPRKTKTIVYHWEPGTLVTITEKQFHQYSHEIMQLGLGIGATGVVVEADDSTENRYRKNVSGNYIHVAGSNGIQKWKACWIRRVDLDLVLTDEDEE